MDSRSSLALGSRPTRRERPSVHQHRVQRYRGRLLPRLSVLLERLRLLRRSRSPLRQRVVCAPADIGVQRAERDASPLCLPESVRPIALVFHRWRHCLDCINSTRRYAIPGRSSTTGDCFDGLSSDVPRSIAVAG